MLALGAAGGLSKDEVGRGLSFAHTHRAAGVSKVGEGLKDLHGEAWIEAITSMCLCNGGGD